MFRRDPDGLRKAMQNAFDRAPTMNEQDQIYWAAWRYAVSARRGPQRNKLNEAREHVEAMQRALFKCARELRTRREALIQIQGEILDDIDVMADFSVGRGFPALAGPDALQLLCGSLENAGEAFGGSKEWNDRYEISGPEGQPHLYRLISQIAEIQAAANPNRKPHALLRAIFNSMPDDVDHGQSPPTFDQTIKDTLAGRRKRVKT